MKIRSHARRSALLNVALDIFRRDSRGKKNAIFLTSSSSHALSLRRVTNRHIDNGHLNYYTLDNDASSAGSPRIHAMRHCAQLAACRFNEEDDLIVREGKLRSRRTQISSSCQSLVTNLGWIPRNERGTMVIVALLHMRLRLQVYTFVRETFSFAYHGYISLGDRVAGLNYINSVKKKSSNRIYETVLYYNGGEWKKEEENEKER